MAEKQEYESEQVEDCYVFTQLPESHQYCSDRRPISMTLTTNEPNPSSQQELEKTPKP